MKKGKTGISKRRAREMAECLIHYANGGDFEYKSGSRWTEADETDDSSHLLNKFMEYRPAGKISFIRKLINRILGR
jgi:hypothetical protein